MWKNILYCLLSHNTAQQLADEHAFPAVENMSVVFVCQASKKLEFTFLVLITNSCLCTCLTFPELRVEYLPKMFSICQRLSLLNCILPSSKKNYFKQTEWQNSSSVWNRHGVKFQSHKNVFVWMKIQENKVFWWLTNQFLLIIVKPETLFISCSSI